MGSEYPTGARQICHALREQILGGVFGENGLLPSSRSLALDLGVSRSTVTLAYEQLAAEGYILIRQGARARANAPAATESLLNPSVARPSGPARLSAYGEWMRAAALAEANGAEAPGGPHMIDFRYGDLAEADFPARIWKKAMASTYSQCSGRLAYSDPRGVTGLRRALQAWLWRARALRCGLDQILVVNGSQQGLDLCARLLLDPGDRFVIENPCYAMARQVFAATGAMACPVPVDAEGMRTDKLQGKQARLAYVTPSHQFPLGSVLAVSRRRQLLDWARQAGAFVIEDDYDSEYRYDIDPVPPLHRLDEDGRTIYLGTVSKTLSPGLRLGYLVVPEALQQVFAAAKQLTDRHSPVALQEALAALIGAGTYEAHIRRVRRLNGERRRTLLNALERRFGARVEISGAEAGLHLVAWFPDIPQADEAALAEAARRQGLGLHAITPLYDPGQSGRPDMAGFIMGYSALEPRRIERGVHLLETVLRGFCPACFGDCGRDAPDPDLPPAGQG